MTTCGSSGITFERLGSTVRVVELSNDLAFGTLSRDGTRYVSPVYSLSKKGPPNAADSISD